MKKFITTTLLLFSFAAQAEKTLDQQLADLIPLFRLETLPEETISDQELYRLGEKLFSSPLLSGNRNISCSTCHDPQKATGDGLPLALGQGLRVEGANLLQGQGKVLARNTPPLFNLGHVPMLFWDSRVTLRVDSVTGAQRWETPVPLGAWRAKLNSALAAQALFPMLSPEEMRGQSGENSIANETDPEKAWQAIADQVAADPEFQKILSQIFPNEKPHIYMLANALAEFQRVHFSRRQTAYDQYLAGNLKALTENQKKGFLVFFDKAQCGRCHNGPLLTDFSLQAVGVPQWSAVGASVDKGVGNLTPEGTGAFRFRVPPLRNVALTAPYMHDGFFKTLEDVVIHYNHFPRATHHMECPETPQNYVTALACDRDPVRNRARLSAAANSISPMLGLNREDVNQLVDFLNSLTEK